MRFVALPLLALLAGAGCSDSSGPDDFELRAGTYDLLLTDCSECAEASTPIFAAAWRDGVAARIRLTDVTEDGALGQYLVLEATGGISLLGALESTTIQFEGVGNTFESTVGFVDGTITLTLVDGGCSFDLVYPGVDTGAGTCGIQ